MGINPRGPGAGGPTGRGRAGPGRGRGAQVSMNGTCTFVADIEIQPGFMVCMTANEGDRYQNRVDMDAAFKDRLDVISFMYPDQSKRPHTDNMPETIRLAFAAAVDNEGTLSANVAIKDLMDLARMAHVSQQLYTQRAQNVRAILSGIDLPNNNTVSSMLDDRPVMTNCISPRDMINSILLAARGNLVKSS